MTKDLVVKEEGAISSPNNVPRQPTRGEPLEIPPTHTIGWSLAGLIVSVGLVGGIVGWSLFTKIDGAVIAPGNVAVESQRKNVQHLEGGIVAEIPVRDGDYVSAGEMVVRLDDTEARSELTAATDQLLGLRARQSRLLAELRGDGDIRFSDPLLQRFDEPKIIEIVNNERDLIASKREALSATVDLLERRIASFQARIDGFTRRRVNSLREMDLLQEQLLNLQSLLARNLVESARVLDVHRAISRLEQEITTGEAESDSLSAQMRESHAQIRQVRAQARADAADDLTMAQREIYMLEERILVLEDRLKRGIVVAPQSGRVLNLAVAAPGAVVRPGETIMEIVPVDDELILLARVPTNDVERVHVGQRAKVRLTAFNLNTTPELIGQVQSVSADVLTDDETGVSFYSAKITLSEDQKSALNGEELVPGMPAEILVSTGERLAASYFVKPLIDAYSRSFKDE